MEFFMFTICYPLVLLPFPGRVIGLGQPITTERGRSAGIVGHFVMSCEANAGGRDCHWCQTDQLIGNCPDLRSVVEGYCPRPEITSWFGVCQHLGGECRACYVRILGRCREATGRACPSGRECSPEDVSQTLFLRLLRSPWRPEKSPLGGWLSLIIKRILSDAMTSAYALHTTLMGSASEEDPEMPVVPDSGWTPGEVAEQADLRRQLWSALDRLSFAERQVITLRFVEGHTLQIISNTLNLPLATLVRRLRKALDNLQRMLLLPRERRNGGTTP